MSSLTPNAKVGAVGITGSVLIVLTFICEQLGWDVPDTVLVAVVSLATFAAGYLVPLATAEGRHAKP